MKHMTEHERVRRDAWGEVGEWEKVCWLEGDIYPSLRGMIDYGMGWDGWVGGWIRLVVCEE